jgi:hypothetical protein
MYIQSVVDFRREVLPRRQSGRPLADRFEFPPYVIDSVYCLYILFFLSICFQDILNRCHRPFRVMKFIFRVYNIIFHFCFILSFVSQAITVIGSSSIRATLSDSIAVVRDFSLCLIYVIFALWLRWDLNDEEFLNQSPNENKLFWLTLSLSIFLRIIHRGPGDRLPRGTKRVPDGLLPVVPRQRDRHRGQTHRILHLRQQRAAQPEGLGARLPHGADGKQAMSRRRLSAGVV